MGLRANLIAVTWICLLTGGAEAVLPPDEIDALKSAAAYRVTVELETVELLERSSTGGLDVGRATGFVLEVTRAPFAPLSKKLQAGDAVSFRAPIWAWADQDREPPGPQRLYWGPDAPPVRLEVWGSFRDGEFIASVFETNDAIDSDATDSDATDSDATDSDVTDSDDTDGGTADTIGSAAATIDRIEQVSAAFVTASHDNLRTDLERATGLRFEPSGIGGDALQADTPATDGWATAATYRHAGDTRILTISLGGVSCVRRADVTARLGAGGEPIPVSPHRSLPAHWYLRYPRPWGSMSFGFRMTQPHDYDDCLTEVNFSHEGRPAGRTIR